MRAQLLGAALTIGAALTLGACGSGSSGSTSNSTIASLTPTNFATVPTVPSTTSTTIAAVPGGSIPGESSYTIAAGDFPSTIATRFKVKFADLLALNGWTLVGQQVTNFPAVGTVIKIPAGATAPGTGTTAPAATGTTTAEGTTSTTTKDSGSTATTTPSTSGSSRSTTTTAAGSSTTAAAGACTTGSYVITKDDTSRVKVATQFDVTVAQLDAANSGTKGYSAFYPGLKIVIPKKAGCP